MSEVMSGDATLPFRFMLTLHALLTGHTHDFNMLGVIRALITPKVYQDRELIAFFDIKNREGMGRLYPTQEGATDPKLGPSTLELHRRALHLAGYAIEKA